MYFDTTFRRAGTQDPIQGRIWRISAAPGKTPELALERQRIGPEPFPQLPGPLPPSAYRQSNPFSLSRPIVSADGSKLAFTSTRACIGRGCLGRENSTANFLLPGAEPREIQEGFGLMSRNGRYVGGVVTHISSHFVRIVDIETGALILSDWPVDLPDGSGWVIADNGWTVLQHSDSLWLAQPGAPPRRL